MPSPPSLYRRLSPLVFGGLLMLGSLPLAAVGYPSPRGDDVAYKSPAAEWAAHGRLIVPALTGLLETADVGFAHYPPLFPLLYGLWFRLCGFSLTSQLALTYGIHILHSLLVGATAARLLDERPVLPRFARRLLIVGATSAVYLNTAYFDRPEELGLCCFWVGFLNWGANPRPLRFRDVAAWGFIAGTAALIAPFSGLLTALSIVVRAATETAPASAAPASPWPRRLALVAVAALVSSTMTAAWAWSVERSTPGLLRDQLLHGNMAFFSGVRARPWLDRWLDAPRALLFHPPYLPTALLGWLAVPWPRLRGEAVGPSTVRLWLIATIAVAFIALVRPGAYTYTGASLFLLAPLFAVGAARFVAEPTPGLRRLGAAVVVVCVLVGARDLVRQAWYAGRLADDETPAGAARALQARIPPGATVATTPRHWHAFQNRNPWRDAFLASLRGDEAVAACDWLVLYPGVGTPPFLDQFEAVEQSSRSAPSAHTYAYTLWRRRSATARDPARDPVAPPVPASVRP